MKKNLFILLIVLCSLFNVNYSFAQWTNGGTLLSSNTKNNFHVIACANADSGAYVTWISSLKDKNVGDIYLTGFDGEGNFYPGWSSGAKQINQSGSSAMAPVVVASEDGGVVAAWSAILQSDSLFHNYLQKYNKNGDALWNGGNPVMIPANGVDQSRYPIIVSDKHKGIFIVWARYDSLNSSGSLDIYLSHIDSTGSVAKGWDANRTIVTNIADYREYYPRIVVSNDARSLYVMYTQGQILEASIVIKKFNASDGSIAEGWDSAGVVVTKGPEVFTGVMYDQWLFCDKKSDNVVAFWCERIYKDMGEMYMRPIAPDGTLLLTQKRIDGMESPYGSDYLEVAQDDDGNFLVADNRYNDDLSTDLNISKATSGNYMLWQKIPLTHNHNSGFGKPASDGYGGAYLFYRNYQGEMYVIRFDSLGNIFNNWQLPGAYFGKLGVWDSYNPYYDFDVVQGKKGQAIVVWDRSEGGLYKTFACNILPDGTTCSLTPSSVTEINNNTGIKIYPNPFSSEINIDISSSNFKPQTLNFKLYDITGNLLTHELLNQSSNDKINIPDLSAGMYFYMIEENNKIIQIGKIIKD